MAKRFSGNSQCTRTAKLNSEFYSLFSEAEVLEIIQALETRKEIPLKYSYKGRGAKIWDTFYQKYLLPKWYRASNSEIDFLRQNFSYLDGSYQQCSKLNIIDVGSGNSYPVKDFISQLNKLGKINKYIALDISQELLDLSKINLKKWLPNIEYLSDIIDIEINHLPANLCNQENEDTANIILHLGVTLANHQNRSEVLRNLKESMGHHDLLVFTNEIGSNSQWDGRIGGGFKYHVEEIYRWIKNKMNLQDQDCELVRKYDLPTDSIVANIKFLHHQTIDFSWGGIDKKIEFSIGEEMTIWRHHKYQLPELLQEIEAAGLVPVHYTTDKYLSQMMMICKRKITEI